MEDYRGNRSAPIGNESPVPASRPVAGGERDALAEVMRDLVAERRLARRWSIFFRTFGLLLVGGLLAWIVLRGEFATGQSGGVRHTALIDLRGEIDEEGEASADHLIASLRAAFKDADTAGVVLRISSPGGSPVQAGMVHDEIRRLRARHPSIPVYAVVQDICTSGAYYVAVAADRIFVDKASLIGSIGVLMDRFGFVAAMEKLGIERRSQTAGNNKAFLDSFSPETEEQRAIAQKLLDEIHQQFIDVVRKGRGDRLKESAETFSGLFWTGARSIEMGLVDGLGTLDMVARDLLKAETVVDFSTHDNVMERLARRIGASAGVSLLRSLRADAEAPRVR